MKKLAIGAFLLLLPPVLAACSDDAGGEEGGAEVEVTQMAAATTTTETPTEASTPDSTEGATPANAEPEEDPEEAALRVAQAALFNQSGRHYDTLHPAQQALLSRDQYMQCASGDAGAPPDTEIEVIDSYPDSVMVEGVDTESVAVTIAITIPDQGSITHTINMIPLDGEWRSILSEERLIECGVVR